MRHAVIFALFASSMLALGCAPGADTPDAVGAAAQADDDTGFDADYAGCREVANVGLVPTASARPLVPAQFALVGDGTPTTGFVVRTVHCDSISVDGSRSEPGDLVQVGLVIVAPDGDGDINNYTLYYDTTSLALATRLAAAGVPARYAPFLQESLVLNPDGSGQYHFSVPIDPRLSFDGAVGAPATTSIPFTANWWSASGDDTVKMASSFPQLFTAGNSVDLTVAAGSPLASLIGATTVSSWPVLQLFDHFPSAHMNVTIR